MDFEPSYGSSEYSAQAEELFAQYLLHLERGTAPDFEAFCADHEECSDELYGLHADWDNVRGLLAQLEGKRGDSAPAPEPEAREAASESAASATPAPTPEASTAPAAAQALDAQGAPAGKPWKLASLAAAAAVLALGYWVFDLQRSSRVLAREKDALALEERTHRKELEVARQSGEELAEASQILQRELNTTRDAKQELEGKSEGLARDLESERVAKSVLEEDKQELARELQEERERKRIAAAQATLMSTRVAAHAWIEDELQLWPASAEKLPRMQEWLEGARALAEQLGELRAGLPATSAEELPEAGIDEQLATRIELTRRRLETLEGWGAGEGGAHAEAWEEACRRIADSEQFPAYDGLELTPQFALVPLGVSPDTGLWTFADLRTGELPTRDEDGSLQLGDHSALVLQLVPGLRLEGVALEAFFVSAAECSPEQRQRALGTLAEAPAGETPLEAELRYGLDLARLGYEALGAARADLARQSGLELVDWKRRPARPVSAPE